MSAIAPAIHIPVAPTVIAPALDIPAPANVLAGLAAWARSAFRRERTESLEAPVARSLEKAFRQFGRELEG